MMPLAEELRRLITAQGPISIARYMAEVLGHPRYGYYRNRDPLGRRGDFTTAPEISQLFGEIIGLWFLDLWQRSGAPTPVRVIELGPGRGTLMADILRTFRLLPNILRGLEVHLVETSPTLRQAQQKLIPDAQWHDHIQDVEEGFSFILANEFFDALPIRQFIKTPTGWHERLVTWDDAAGQFTAFPNISGADFTPFIPKTLKDAPHGSCFELSPPGLSIADQLCKRIENHGGAALIIDYGHLDHGVGDTLQALKAHSFHDPFKDPGDADVTAHVDFMALYEIAQNHTLTLAEPTTQGDFLKALGIVARARKLQDQATPAQHKDIEAALERLTHKNEMGHLFKVFSFAHKNMAIPAGFP